MDQLVNRIGYSHVAMFIAGSAIANISIIYSLIVSMVLVILLSYKQVDRSTTRSAAKPSVNSDVKPVANKHSVPKHSERAPIPPVHRRTAVSIPVGERLTTKIHDGETIDEKYAFRPYK